MTALRITIEGASGAGASAVFGAKGGTLGRSQHNTLVLADAERSASRLQARVDLRAGGFVLVNMGLKAVIHNGALLGPADEAPLGVGDVLRIGRFILLVEAVDEAQAALANDEALFDDMTGEPLAPRGAAWPDIALFDDSTGTGTLRPVGGSSDVAVELLRGMDCTPPPDLPPLTSEQTGQLVRRAIEDTLRTWIPHCSPAVQKAWFTSFEEALARALEADRQVARR